MSKSSNFGGKKAPPFKSGKAARAPYSLPNAKPKPPAKTGRKK